MWFLDKIRWLWWGEKLLSPQDETKKNLQKALEDSFSSLENLNIQDAIRDMRALADIEEEQIKLGDMTHRVRDYLQEKLLLVYVYFVWIGNQEAIDAFCTTFWFNADNNKITRSVYEIYKSLQKIEEWDDIQNQHYDDMKKRLESDLINQQDALQQKINDQVSIYDEVLQQYEQYANNFWWLSTPEQYESDLKESLRSSKGDMDVWEQYLAEQTKDRIIAYRDVYDAKKQKLDALRADLLQWWKKLEKVKFSEQEERAQEILLDLQTNNDFFSALNELEQRAKDIVSLRQELRLNTRLDVDLTSSEEAGKMSWPYLLQAYKLHANFLANQEGVTLWIDANIVNDLSPYIDQEIENLWEDKKFLLALEAKSRDSHLDVSYAHPDQVLTIMLLHKHRKILEKIWMLNKYVEEDKKRCVYLQSLLDEYVGTKNPVKKFNLLYSADYILQLANQKTVVVKWGKYYELQWDVPRWEMSVVDLYKKYIDIRLIPIDSKHKLYDALWNPESELSQKIHKEESHSEAEQRIDDKRVIEKEYDILRQDSLYVYEISLHKIISTDTSSDNLKVVETVALWKWNQYLTSVWENVFERAFSLKETFSNGFAKVNDGPHKHYVINKGWENVLWDVFAEVKQVFDWMFAVKKFWRWRFVNESWEDIYDKEFYDVGDTSEWYIAVQESWWNGYFYMNQLWESALQNTAWVGRIFKRAYPFSEGLAVVKDWDTYRVIDASWKYAFDRRLAGVLAPHKFEWWYLKVRLSINGPVFVMDTQGNMTSK